MHPATRQGPGSRLARAAGIRPGEGRVLGLVAALFTALEAGRGLRRGRRRYPRGEPFRRGNAAVPVHRARRDQPGRRARRMAPPWGGSLERQLLVGSCSRQPPCSAPAECHGGGHRSVIPAVWLVTYASGAIAGTISWTVAGSVFDARQAKRLFPLCTGAAIAGSFVGTLASGPLARPQGRRSWSSTEAVLLVVVAVLIVSISRTGRVRLPPRVAPVNRSSATCASGSTRSPARRCSGSWRSRTSCSRSSTSR